MPSTREIEGSELPPADSVETSRLRPPARAMNALQGVLLTPENSRASNQALGPNVLAVVRGILTKVHEVGGDVAGASARLHALAGQQGYPAVLSALLHEEASAILVNVAAALTPGLYGHLVLDRRVDGGWSLMAKHDGKANGLGFYAWNNGDTYLGEWVAGQRQGRCVMHWSNGTSHVGTFAGGHFAGPGVRTFSNGSKYDGMWEESRRNGQGTLTSYLPGTNIQSANESQLANRYEGHWSDDKFDGEGVLEVYGRQTDASGKLHPYTIRRYEGTWKAGQKHGPGRLQVYDKPREPGGPPLLPRRTYEGAFVNDKQTGSGREVYNAGSMYVGMFESGAFNGPGTQSRAGDELEAHWSRGAVSVVGMYRYANGARSVWDSNARTLGPAEASTPLSSSTQQLLTAADSFVHDEDWLGLVAWRAAHSDLLEQAAKTELSIAPLSRWNANLELLTMVGDVLAHAEHASIDEASGEPVSPTTRERLRVMAHLLGPARAYQVQPLMGQPMSVSLHGNDATMAHFIARTMPITGSAYVHLLVKDYLNYIFHQEHYQNPRAAFLTTQEELLGGLAMAWRADKERSDKAYSNCNMVLRHWLDRGPCLDGGVSMVINTLSKLGLITDVGRQIADTNDDAGLIQQGERHLQAFREQQLDTFARDRGLTKRDTVVIEADVDFQNSYFNSKHFESYLERQKFSREDIAAILEYQEQVIRVL